VHVVTGFAPGAAPSTRSAVAILDTLSGRKNVLVVVERSDEITWKSLRNVERVHLLVADQLNTYDVLVSDDVVFTQGALDAFLAGPATGRSVTAAATESEAAIAEEGTK
jgi:large subunit ribosomal protein L4